MQGFGFTMLVPFDYDTGQEYQGDPFIWYWHGLSFGTGLEDCFCRFTCAYPLAGLSFCICFGRIACCYCCVLVGFRYRLFPCSVCQLFVLCFVLWPGCFVCIVCVLVCFVVRFVLCVFACLFGFSLIWLGLVWFGLGLIDWSFD